MEEESPFTSILASAQAWKIYKGERAYGEESSTYEVGLQISSSVDPEISAESKIWEIPTSDRGDTSAVM